MKIISVEDIILGLLFFSIFIFTSCRKESDLVVVYTTVDQVFSEQVLKKFEAQSKVKVKALYDTEETKSTGILNRLLAEKNNPQCDVFWSGDPVRTVILENERMLQPYISKSAKGINKQFKDKNHLWTGFSARARVLIYNKDLLKDTEVPKSIFDLAKDKYNGKVAIANPLFGTTTFHIAALFTIIGDNKAKDFLQKLKNNNIIIATSNGDVKKRVINGEAACGLTDTDDAFEALNEGNNIGIVFLDQNGIGSLIMPNTVSLIKKKYISENAKKLIDFLLSKETESELSFSCAQMPLHKGVKTAKNIPSPDKIKAMKIDYISTAKKLKEIQNYLKKWVEN